MRAKLTKDGLLIPRQMLPNVEEVEIRPENGGVLVLPIQSGDPILALGSAPIECGVPDAAARHDSYLYDSSD
jgi:hypothetical protein